MKNPVLKAEGREHDRTDDRTKKGVGYNSIRRLPSVWQTVTAWRRGEEPLYGSYSYYTMGFRLARTRK